ncbi:MAG: Uma2 family endonuclease [Chitinophagaceae bacterium]|nr:Uma2 family endonuclease [Anaerolineae bacterium]
MAAQPRHVWTEAEYLEFERASESRHEYYRGEIFDMAGASPAHVLIATNASGILYVQLRKRPCAVYQTDLRVKVKGGGLYTYPDIVVVCGSPEYADEKRDMIVNPTLIIEVLSSSTESYDRGEKFRGYRNLDSLQEYLLIAQDTPRIERYLRQSSNEWLLTEITGLDATLELPSIQCTLALVDVYEKVTFEENPV